MPDTGNQPPKPAFSLSRQLRKGVFIVILLTAAWLVFGQIIPHSLTAQPQEAENAIQDTLKQKDEKIVGLESRVEQLEAKLKALEDVVAAAPKTLSDDTKIQALEAKIDAMQPAESGADVAHIEEEVHGLKAQVEELQSKHNRQFLALTTWNNVKEAAARGDALGAPLAQLIQLTQGNAAAQELLKQLTLYAATSPVTLSLLQSRFEAAVPVALSGKESSWTQALQSMIRIRKVGERQIGGDDEALIARAEAKLDKADVEGSLKELTPLSAPAAAAFAPWIAQAQEFLKLRGAMDALQPLLMQDAQPAQAVP